MNRSVREEKEINGKTRSELNHEVEKLKKQVEKDKETFIDKKPSSSKKSLSKLFKKTLRDLVA